MTTATVDRDKLQRRIDRVRALVEHPRTNEHLRAVATHKLAKLLAQLDKTSAAAHRDTRWYGAKYDHSGRLTTVDIAKLIREEIKLARKLAKDTGGSDALAAIDPIGDAPAGIKFSVRSEYFSGGSSIDITVKGVPREWGWTRGVDPRFGREERWMHTPALKALLNELNAVMNAYNHDGSDIMTDYSDVRFYGSVTTAYEDDPR